MPDQTQTATARTPWWLRAIGYPPRRRHVLLWSGWGVTEYRWEYVANAE